MQCGLMEVNCAVWAYGGELCNRLMEVNCAVGLWR